MAESFWDVLGIEATTDERAIKRAYAARLKVTSPEKDAAGYMKLRDAYETAKRYAEMQRHLASAQKAQELEQSDEAEAAAVDRAAEAHTHQNPAHQDPPLSLQQLAFAELQALLAEQKLDWFLQRIEDIQAAQTFSTLDEQYYFVGEVARLVQDAEIEDREWCGRLAALLGAREHENIFAYGTRYWFAYQRLAESYAALRAATARAHVDDQREIAATPGYLHVYHVLTAPFDAERLSALTRSRTYHRLAEHILERAKSDSSIVIPPENREWWERTAMAGQHRPVAEPVPVAAAPVPAPEDSSSMFPSWSIWILLVVLAQVVRMCTSVSAPGTEFHVDQSQIDQRYRDNSPPLIVQHPAQDVLATDNEVARRLSLCDTKTRQKLIMYLRISQANRRSAESTVTDPSTGPQKPGLVLDESDPIVAALLENCQGSRYFDSNGMLKELPPPELPRNELPASQ